MPDVQGEAAPRESLYEKGGADIAARREGTGVRSDTAARAEALIEESRQQITDTGQTIGSRRSLIKEDRSGLEAAFNMADESFRQKKEETRQKVK